MQKPKNMIIVMALLMGAVHAASARTQPLAETKLTPVDPLQGELFGASVALDGMVAVVGANRDNSPVTNTGQYGTAHVFRFTGGAWIEEAKLTAPAARSPRLVRLPPIRTPSGSRRFSHLHWRSPSPLV